MNEREVRKLLGVSDCYIHDCLREAVGVVIKDVRFMQKKGFNPDQWRIPRVAYCEKHLLEKRDAWNRVPGTARIEYFDG